MTQQEQRIAIAEACNAQLYVLHKPIHDPFGYYRENARGYTSNISEAWKVTLEVGRKYVNGKSDQPDRVVLEPAPLPDYLHDLNAVHQAEKTLTIAQQDAYACFLGAITGGRCIDYGATRVDATTAILFAEANQRAEAFLRATGRWKD